MPKTMCPLCGHKTHVNTGDPAGWERRYPELLIVGFACRLCPECAPEIIEGDRVLIREAEIDTGRVERIAVGTGGFKLFRIQLDSGGEDTFPRAKLSKLPAQAVISLDYPQL